MRTLLLVIMMGALLLTGCSEQTQQRVEEASESVVSDARQHLEGAAESTQETVDRAQLTGSVKAALLASDLVSTENLNVETEDGTVYLKGSVAEESQVIIAQEIARNTVPEGTEVINQIEVGDDESVADTDAEFEDTASSTPSYEE